MSEELSQKDIDLLLDAASNLNTIGSTSSVKNTGTHKIHKYKSHPTSITPIYHNRFKRPSVIKSCPMCGYTCKVIAVFTSCKSTIYCAYCLDCGITTRIKK